MSATPDEPTGPAPVSRRETLRRAAGALALGLGLPASALAADADEADELQLLFYRGDDERPFHATRVDERAAEVLLDERSRVFLKLDGIDGESARMYAKVTWHRDGDWDR